ncbi:MAG: hypothetical protein RL684_2300 [Pseudomonadota bacterium]
MKLTSTQPHIHAIVVVVMMPSADAPMTAKPIASGTPRPKRLPIRAAASVPTVQTA